MRGEDLKKLIVKDVYFDLVDSDKTRSFLLHNILPFVFLEVFRPCQFVGQMLFLSCQVDVSDLAIENSHEVY